MDSNTVPLGKLKSLGITEPWQVALYLPETWDDYRIVFNSAPVAPSDLDQACFKGRLYSFDTRFDKAPRTVCKLSLDDHSIIGFTFFGDTREMDLSEGKQMVVHGRLSIFKGDIWLEGATMVKPSMVGRLIPRYKGIRGVMKPETVRTRVFGLLRDAIPIASTWINNHMGPALTRVLSEHKSTASISDVLKIAHLPESIDSGRLAQSFLEDLAALNLAMSISDMQKKMVSKSLFSTPATNNLPERVKAFPFTMTNEQKNCVRDAIRDIRSGIMHRVLSGEVGTGKTAVYGLLAAVCIDGGAKVAIMAPNQSLVRQIHSEISTWWPDLKPQLITGDTEDIQDTRLLIGTTALLHRPLPKLSLVITDEQHKFSREQREKLTGSGVHLLEVSATCIPRSQALIRYGVVDVSKLEHCHVKKNITTKVWMDDGRSELFSNIKQSIARGDKILVIYPKREGEQEEGKLPSADQAYTAWNNVFPGDVRLAHGGLSGEDNQKAIDDVSSGAAHILISTTVVEVGINIPGLRHAVVVHAERFGLTTLHQIRGRVSRDGGSGLFDLYLPVSVKDAVLQRLSVLENESNGFIVAEMDMKLRGFGDLTSNSSKQTGSDDTFLIGRPISMESMDKALALI